MSLIRLMSWLTPAMPTGAFAWSGGLEAAIRDGHVTDAPSLAEWIEALLSLGSMRTDAILLSLALRGEEVAPLALALAGSAERHAETEEQGDAFLRAASAWIDAAPPPRPCPLPCAVGWAARQAELAPRDTIAAYLHAQVSGAVQAALRLMPLGQTGAVMVMARIETAIAAAAAFAETATEDDIATAAIGAEIAALRHGALPARLFRS